MSAPLATVPITDVRPDPKQPRTYFKESALRQLATSIKKTGQRQPITVRARKAGSKPPFEIIDGERRWRACQLAGISTIRIDIENSELTRHASQHLMSLASNFMREGHTHMEISHALQYQVDAATDAGQTRGQAVQELVEAIGKSETWVYQYLGLQSLDADLQALMHPDTPDKTRLRLAEAVLIASQPPTKQRGIYRAAIRTNPAMRMECIRKLITAANGGQCDRRNKEINATTTRFFARVSAEVERMLDYKDTDFQKALAKIPPVELNVFRASLAMLLDAVDRAKRIAKAK